MTQENVSKAIQSKSDDKSRNPTARLVDEIANSIENPQSLNLQLDAADKSHFLDGLVRADALGKLNVLRISKWNGI
jgi:hypothetical protein